LKKLSGSRADLRLGVEMAYLPENIELSKQAREEVVALIIERAEREHPNDFTMQAFVIKQQLDALERIEKIKVEWNLRK